MATIVLDLPLRGDRNYLEAAAIWQFVAQSLIYRFQGTIPNSDLKKANLNLTIRKPVRCVCELAIVNAKSAKWASALVTAQFEDGGPISVALLPTDRALSARIPDGSDSFLNDLVYNGRCARLNRLPDRDLADLYVTAGKSLLATLGQGGKQWIITGIDLPLEHAINYPSEVSLTITRMASHRHQGICDVRSTGLTYPSGRLKFLQAPEFWAEAGDR